MTSGWQGVTVLQEIRSGAGFETGDFGMETLGGGATVERLMPDPSYGFEGIRSCNPTNISMRSSTGQVHYQLIQQLQPLQWDVC